MPKPSLPHRNIKRTAYLGLDPGKSGGIAALYQSHVFYCQMPETPRDLAIVLTGIYGNMWDAITDYRLLPEDAVAVIELVHSSPQMGVASAFTFGRGYGTLLGALASVPIPVEEVSPQRWQKALGIPKRDTKSEPQPLFKKRLRAEAQKLFPSLPLWQETMGKQLACADALLLAEYCRRKHTGCL